MRALKTAEFTWILVGNGSHVGTSRVFLRFDLAHCKDFFRDRNYIVWIPRCLQIKVLVYFDGGIKVSLYRIFRNRWKNLMIVLVSQNNIKNTGPCAGTIHKQLG